MSCQTVRNSLSGYLDQNVSEVEKALVTSHLAWCRDCAAYLAGLAELRRDLQSLPVAPVPASLRTELQIIASREQARAVADSRLPVPFRTWVDRIRLALDNLMRPLAVPFAGGLLSALLLFGVMVPVLGFRPAVRNDVPTSLYTAATLVEVTSLGTSDDEPVVELFIDAKGQATDYTVQSGSVSPEMQADLNKMIVFSRFTPATWFGQPTSGKLLVGFRRVRYTVHG